jgi:hypothetical protein
MLCGRISAVSTVARQLFINFINGLACTAAAAAAAAATAAASIRSNHHVMGFARNMRLHNILS